MGHDLEVYVNLEKLANYLATIYPRGMTVAEMGEFLGITRQAAYDYQKDLEARYGLEKNGRRYALPRERLIEHVNLSIEEAWGVYLGLRRFARQTTHAPSFVISGLQKVARALRHPDLTEQLEEASRNLQHDKVASAEQAAIWRTLIRGWREKIVIRMTYRGAKSDDDHIYEIEPLLFEPATLSHGAYLIAWSRQKDGEAVDELRTFKLARIDSARETTLRFEEREIDFNDLLRTAWSIWYGKELVRVELLFSPRVAWRVKETLWHPLQEWEEQADGSLYWTVEVAGTLELLSWVRGWGPDVEVLAPESFRQKVIKQLHEAIRIYEEA